MSSVTPLPPAGPADAAVGATILVVDDSPVNLRLVVRTLEGRGYRLLAAKNGRAALDIARRVHPDLILLDVMMPELDGFEVCRALKSDPSTRDAIVVFLSALGEVTDKVILSLSSAILTARVFSVAMVATRSTPWLNALGSILSSLSFAVGMTRL